MRAGESAGPLRGKVAGRIATEGGGGGAREGEGFPFTKEKYRRTIARVFTTRFAPANAGTPRRDRGRTGN